MAINLLGHILAQLCPVEVKVRSRAVLRGLMRDDVIVRYSLRPKACFWHSDLVRQPGKCLDSKP